MPTPIGSKLWMRKAVDEWDLKQGTEAKIYRCSRDKSNRLTFDIEWYHKGTKERGKGLRINEVAILSTPDGRVLPRVLPSMPEGHARPRGL